MIKFVLITNSLLRLGVDNRRFRQQQCETFATIIQRRPSAYVAKNFRSSNLASTKMPKQQNISSAQFVCGSSNAANYVQRKYYTPKSISQQADETPSSDDEEDRKAEYDFRNVNSSFPEHSAMHIGVSCLSSAATIVRELGGLEHMYNIYTTHGAEVVCLMTRIESKYLVTKEIALEAFLLLLRRHSILRTSIKTKTGSRNGEQVFVEYHPSHFDFDVLSRTDWLDVLLEQASRPFQGSDNPLLRCRMLDAGPTSYKDEIQDFNMNPKPQIHLQPRGFFGYQSTFVFVVHHSIMDGGYCLWMFQEYMNFIDAVAMGNTIHRVKELPVLPPVENMMTFPSENGTSCEISNHNDPLCSTRFSVKLCHDSNQDQLLKDYNVKFSDEINLLSDSEPKNGCLSFKISIQDSKQFVHRCKQHQCRPKGVLATAWLFALLELVYDDIRSIEIPLEYMMDFRRFCDFSLMGQDVPHYPGTAAIHVPFVAQIQRQRGPVLSSEFWEISKLFDSFLTTNVFSRDTFEWIKHEAEKYKSKPLQQETKGKSPYVLCISNMGVCDGVLHDDVNSRMRLVGLHGHSTVLIDDMPLFFVTVFTLNGKLCGNASFCESYTSSATAMKLIGLFKKYITLNSKL
ncbi:uncharacterized protein LOC128216844 isoform X2 [Mya arenaria]|uniref:uncharacterized protein LOC128216844 isoform X2 n=1 Tax=Mya arenaria TaxID=6604 RepID=UPI0022E4E0B3|nr:uncharacterized protein LOC128216844 isoform X2 [Mya arenaria]